MKQLNKFEAQGIKKKTNTSIYYKKKRGSKVLTQTMEKFTGCYKCIIINNKTMYGNCTTLYCILQIVYKQTNQHITR